MRTTLVIPDPVYRELKRRAADTGNTISGLVTEFIRRGLAERPESAELPALPAASLGRPRVDVSDRDALYRVLDAGRDRRLYGPGEDRGDTENGRAEDGTASEHGG